MKTMHPEWLWATAPLALLALVLCWWCGRELRRRLKLFVASPLHASMLDGHVLLRKRLRVLLVCGVLASLAVALSRPFGEDKEAAVSKHGVNILVALDASRSMWSEDVAPDRFTLAQAGIDELLGDMQGDRAGLMLFAGEPILASPLTFDTVSLQLIAQGMTVELAGKGGSSLSAVIERAAQFFAKGDYGSKVLLVFTDGEETEGDAVVAAQQAYRDQGLRNFTVGVGTQAGSVIPRRVRNAQRELVLAGNVRDPEGREVHSKLNEQMLRDVAQVGGGSYRDLREANGDLSNFYEQEIKPLAAPMDQVSLQEKTEWFHIPLLVALGLLVLEMLIPQGVRRQAGLRNVTPVGRLHATAVSGSRGRVLQSAAVVVCVMLCALPVKRVAAAGVEEQAQGLLTAGKFDEAFSVLQRALLDDPNDLLTQYNYAIGAYAAGRYSVAIERLEALSVASDSQVSGRSHMQLGNAHYHLGAQMQKSSAVATVAQWEKALAAYDKAATDPSTAHNRAKVQRDLLALLGKLAREREAAGDEAARLTADQGTLAWREALAHLDKALSIAGQTPPPRALDSARRRVVGKIYDAYLGLAQDKQRRAEYQRYTALELAIEQVAEAVADYDEALTMRPQDSTASAGRAEAAAGLEEWLVELADRQHEEGVGMRANFLEDAMTLWEQAEGNYQKVLQNNAQNAGALRGKERNDLARHDGYVALGDLKRKRAAPAHVPVAEKDQLLEAALGDYGTALNLQPQNAATAAKIRELGGILVERFVERGQAEFEKGSKAAASMPPDAIAWLERAVQSFTKGLRYDNQHVQARSGKQSAESLLNQLRDQDAQDQRRALAENKEMSDARQLEDPGELALKLLDYDTDKLASRKEQNFTAPEDPAVKDW